MLDRKKAHAERVKQLRMANPGVSEDLIQMMANPAAMKKRRLKKKAPSKMVSPAIALASMESQPTPAR